jgi:hypothetical protein
VRAWRTVGAAATHQVTHPVGGRPEQHGEDSFALLTVPRGSEFPRECVSPASGAGPMADMGLATTTNPPGRPQRAHINPLWNDLERDTRDQLLPRVCCTLNSAINGSASHATRGAFVSRAGHLRTISEWRGRHRGDMASSMPDILEHVCECCGSPMKLVRSVPALGVLPELHSFRCERCRHVETIETTKRASSGLSWAESAVAAASRALDQPLRPHRNIVRPRTSIHRAHVERTCARSRRSQSS